MGVRDYEGIGIVVHWDADRCQHSANCVNGAPTVFDTTKRPWISAGALGADELAAVIDTCPSGALSYTRTDGGPHGRRGHAADEDPTTARRPDDARAPSSVAVAPLAAAGDASAPVTVTPRENGPLVVDGPIGLRAPDGTVEVVDRLVLCRCGGSSNKPRCDGTHKRNGFRGPGMPVPIKPG